MMCLSSSLEWARVSGTNEPLYQALPSAGDLSAWEMGC